MMKTNRQSEKKGKKFRNLLFWAGFLICIFPVISNIVERQRQADAVATYRQTMEKEDEKEIEECFYKDLKFGKGDIRAIMGPGPNKQICHQKEY